MKEEVGLDVEVERLAGVYSKPYKNEVVFSCVCKIVGGQLTTTKEADRIGYFGLGEIPSNTIPKQVERIRDVLTGQGKVVLKVQDGLSSYGCHRGKDEAEDKSLLHTSTSLTIMVQDGGERNDG